MRVLVTAASRHGATDEVADAIAQQLRDAGLTVDRVAPRDVEALDGYDAVVVGSSVRMRRWEESVQDFLHRFEKELKTIPTWGFSVGMSGVPKRAPQDPRRIGPAEPAEMFREHRAFAGRYDPALLPLRDRSLAKVAGAVEGDFRDWTLIEQWAQQIGQDLLGDGQQAEK